MMLNKFIFVFVMILSLSFGVTGNVIGGRNTGLYSIPLTANYSLTSNIAISMNAQGLMGAISVTPAGYVGIGTTSPSTKLEVAGTVSASALVVNGGVTLKVVVTTNATVILDSSQYIVAVDASSAPVVMTVPVASSCFGRHYVVMKIDDSANTVTLTGDNVNGLSSYVLRNSYDMVSLVSIGTQWVILSK